ncbi:hypothetical protein Tco_0333224 [Tanacetum coccineum]
MRPTNTSKSTSTGTMDHEEACLSLYQHLARDFQLWRSILQLITLKANNEKDNWELQRHAEVDMKEILHNRMWESKSYQTHEDHMTLYEALENSMARDNRDQLLSDLVEVRKKKKKRQGLPKTPPGSPPHPPPHPPPPAGPSGTLGASGAFGSSQSQPPPLPPSNN